MRFIKLGAWLALTVVSVPVVVQITVNIGA